MIGKGTRILRFIYAFATCALLSACGGGSGGTSTDGGDTGGSNGGGSNSGSASNCEGTGSVAVNGKARYEFVPAVHPGGTSAYLDYDNSEFRPIRRAVVEAACPDGSAVYATTFTDDNGNYTLNVPENVDVQIRVLASLQSSTTPSWDMEVVDNTSGQAVWTLEGDAFNSETGSVTANLKANSGWGGSNYTGTRAAGPFAIMDSIYTAMQKVVAADPAADFPALKVNWSPFNTSSCNSENGFPYSDGCIGTSFYADYGSSGRNIFILGEEGNDTDEYDNHVIIHEWGHYYEDVFARSDSIGGQHGGGDTLDMRVAFGEGWGNAWSGIATDDSLYVDTMGSRQGEGFSFDVDGEAQQNPGWWNEFSVQEILFDLYDGGAGDDDGVTDMGFAPLHQVLTTSQRNSSAATSIFPLVYFLKQSGAADPSRIGEIVRNQEISEITDEWGSGRGSGGALGLGFDDRSPEGNTSNAQYVSPIYQSIALEDIQGGNDIEICVTNYFADGENEYNRIGARRFLTFQVPSDGNWLVTLDGSANNGQLGNANYADPDFFIALHGEPVTADREQGVPASGVDNSGTTSNPDGPAGVETATVSLVAGQTYLIEAVEYLNVDDDTSTGGDACMQLSFQAQ